MLILSRKVDEAIVFSCPDGTQIEVMVTDIRRTDSGKAYCKLGITAPQAVLIRRDELPEMRIYTEVESADSSRDG